MTTTMDDASAELAEAEMAARTKMEHHASYLIRQVEAIEALSKECRGRTKELERNNVSSASEEQVKSPNSFSISYEGTSNGQSKDASCSPLESSVMETPRRSYSGALADDLSSCYTTTPATTATTSKGDHLTQQQRLQQLEVENQRLRDALSRCCEAAVRIQTNAHLKSVRLEHEVTHLRQQLAHEEATNSKFRVLNQSLRKRLHAVGTEIVQNKSNSAEDKRRFVQFSELHQRELTVEKHLNSLILSRNVAIKESTALKRLLLGTCLECRQKLPIKRKASQGEKGTATSSAKRPTYQTSARQVLENLPKRQPVAPKSSEQPEEEPNEELPPKRLVRRKLPQSSKSKLPVKSCLKTSGTSPPSSSALSDKTALTRAESPSNPRISPTSTTAFVSTASDSPSPPLPPCFPKTTAAIPVSPPRTIFEANLMPNSGITNSSSSTSREGLGQQDRLSFRQRLEDKLQPCADDHDGDGDPKARNSVDENSSAAKHNQQQQQHQRQPSVRDIYNKNLSLRNAVSSAATNTSTTPTSDKSKSKGWRRRAGGGLFGGKGKRSTTAALEPHRKS